ncbi:EamA family transporter [Providencia stuartii]|uniref:EamA family transporter n=1 Tax=Providencia TaxID=586 RepID=UPI00076B3BA7|nr:MULTISPECIES: DMT family transporter [Providencia]AMG67657.1 EamA/RhaT family transporter [Providencia stuartii]MCR4081693.1 DMT family transporter [Providencia stuartii]MDX7494695.1 DMT family transporter [Providencia stuartii]SST05092.1 carboxylate/amino acid/amine transporter [Acinetobacter baumannii]
MKLKGLVLVSLGACSYGILSTLVVLAYQAGFSLNDVIGSQTVLGAVLLWLFVLIGSAIRRKSLSWPSKKQSILMLLMGTTTGLTGLLYYASLQYLSPALGVVLFLQFTWMGVAINTAVTRRAPTAMTLVSVLFILIGTTFATGLLNTMHIQFHWLGVALGLCAALSNAIRVYVSGALAVKTDPMMRSAIMVTGGAILTSVIVPPTFLCHFSTFNSLFFSYGLPLAFFGSFFGMWMFAKGTPLIGTSLATILSSMQLPVTILLSVTVLHLPLEFIQFVGVAIILFGVTIAEVKIKTNKQMLLNKLRRSKATR